MRLGAVGTVPQFQMDQLRITESAEIQCETDHPGLRGIVHLGRGNMQMVYLRLKVGMDRLRWGVRRETRWVF